MMSIAAALSARTSRDFVADLPPLCGGPAAHDVRGLVPHDNQSGALRRLIRHEVAANPPLRGGLIRRFAPAG
jgi:hypothetical protein